MNSNFENQPPPVDMKRGFGKCEHFYFIEDSTVSLD